MKKVLLAALMAGVASSAMAADLPTRKGPPPAPAYYAPPFSWTGFYVGVNGGLGAAAAGGGAFGSPSGGLVGGTVGYNYQIGQFVIGAEGAGLGGSQARAAASTFVGSYSNKVDDTVTARARAGIAMTAPCSTSLPATPAPTSRPAFRGIASYLVHSGWQNGGALGGGIEYAFTNNISVKAEYLFDALQRQDLSRRHARRREERPQPLARPRRPELQVLIGSNRQFQSPAGRPAGLFLVGAVRFRPANARRLEGRKAAAKASSQATEPRMIGPPRAGKAQIEIAERAGERDRADVARPSAAGAASSAASARATFSAWWSTSPTEAPDRGSALS